MLPRMLAAWFVVLEILVATTVASTSCAAPEQISTQGDIDLLLPCTNITTYVTLGDNLTGTFSLPNLVSAYAFYASSNSTLANIFLPNLISVASSISISLPNLTTLDASSLKFVGGNVELNTPSLASWNGTRTLQNATQIHIQAHKISALEFGSLSNVSSLEVLFASPNGSLYLDGSSPDMDLILSGANDTTLKSYLRSHGSIFLSGLSSISISAANCSALIVQNNPQLEKLLLPNLASIGPSNFSLAPTLASAAALDVSDVLVMAHNMIMCLGYFPVLRTVQGSIQIMGSPRLGYVTGTYVEGLPAGGVAFPQLSNVTNNILISGDVDLVQLPSLLANQYSIGGHINITTTYSAFNCSSLYPFYDLNIMKVLILICVTPTGNYSLPEIYTSPTPTATADSSNKGMSKTEMISVGIGVAVGSLIVSTGLAFWIIRARGI